MLTSCLPTPTTPPPHKLPPLYTMLPLPSQDLRQPSPCSPRPQEVPFHFRKVIIRRRQKFPQKNGTKTLPPEVSRYPRITSPSVLPLPQQPTSVASSLSRVCTTLKTSELNSVPPMRQTCNTGGSQGEIDSPPPGLQCCPEGVGDLTCRISDNEISLFSHASRYQMFILQKEMIFFHCQR